MSLLRTENGLTTDFFVVKCTGRGLVVKRPGVLSKVQMLNLVLGVGVFSLPPNDANLSLRMQLHKLSRRLASVDRSSRQPLEEPFLDALDQCDDTNQSRAMHPFWASSRQITELQFTMTRHNVSKDVC